MRHLIVNCLFWQTTNISHELAKKALAQKGAARAARFAREQARSAEATAMEAARQAEWAALDTNITTAGKIAKSARNHYWDDLDQSLKITDAKLVAASPQAAKMEADVKALEYQYGEQALDHLASINAWANTPV